MAKAIKKSKRRIPTTHELKAATALHARRHNIAEAPKLRLPKGAHPESFGLKLVGDCLDPMVKNGQIALIEPIRPDVGDLAAIWVKGSKMPALKILRTPLTGFPLHPESEVVPIYEFEQLNPPKRYAVDASRIEEVFRVHSVLDGDGIFPPQPRPE